MIDLDSTLLKLKALIKKKNELEKEINESELVVKLLELNTQIMYLREDILLLQAPIFIDDQLNPEVVNRIKLILNKIGFEFQVDSRETQIDGRIKTKLVYEGETFDSCSEALNYILYYPTIEVDLTEEEKLLISRFAEAINNINFLI